MYRFFDSVDHYDAWINLILGSIAFIASVSFIALNLLFKASRTFPSSLLIIISFGEACLSLNWLLSGLYSDFIWQEGLSIQDKDLFCRFNSWLTFVGSNIQFVFQIFFILALIIKFRNALGRFKYEKLFVILPCLLVCVSFSFVAMDDFLGKNIYGFCTIKTTNYANIIFVLALLGVYSVLVLYALYILRSFKNNTLKNLTIKNSHQFYQFYLYYSLSMLMYFIVSAGSYFITIAFNAHLRTHNDKCDPKCITLFFMGRLLNNLRLYFPIISFMFRVSDPYLKNLLKSYFRRKKWEREKKIEESMYRDNHNLTQTLMLAGGRNNNNFTETFSSELHTNSFTVDHNDLMITQTLNRIKMFCTKTILQSLYVYYRNFLPNILSYADDRLSLLCDNINFDIDTLLALDVHSFDDTIRERGFINNNEETRPTDLEEWLLGTRMRRRSESRDSNVNVFIPPEFLTGDVSVRFPGQFCEIIKDRSSHPNQMYLSFDQGRNKESIRQTGNTRHKGSVTGGASGEFFFRTFDRKFIIKTITEAEEEIFEEFMSDYLQHLRDSPNSVLTRFLGYFNFEFDILDTPVRVVVMENIFCVNSEILLRKYDLKGSTHHRKVLHARDSRLSNLDLDLRSNLSERQTLKDLDFNRIEGKILMSTKQRKEFFNVIENDVLFLQSQKLIDYSLIVAVIRLQDVQDKIDDPEYEGLKEDINNMISRKTFYSDSTFEFAYIVGVIDMFQKYTLKKFLEKHWKVLVNCRCGLDTSSQPAHVYSKRFLRYIDSIFLDDRPFYRLTGFSGSDDNNN